MSEELKSPVPTYPEFTFTEKIEDMSEEALAKRIKDAMEVPFRYNLSTIPYEGEEEQIITYEYPELIGLCPATGYPDTYNLRIVYVPNRLLPELKTLRFYMFNYHNLPISHEHMIDRIRREFVEAVQPKRIRLEIDVAVRGGIFTTTVMGDKELQGKKHEDLVRN